MFDPTPQVLKKIEVAVPRKTSVEAENLRRARALIASEENWCINDLHRIGPKGQQQHCALGALEVVSNRHFGHRNSGSWILDELALNAGEWGVASFNNRRGHAATIALFDRAIEIAESIPA